MRKFFICILILVFSFSFCFAYSGSTSNGLSQNNSNVQNLISYASNFDGFFNSDYVVFQDDTTSYYIVWGDLTSTNDNISGSNVDMIHYYRTGNTGSTYNYIHSVESNFQLSLNHSVVTNISGVGSQSALYEQLYFYHQGIILLLLTFAACFTLMLCRK